MLRRAQQLTGVRQRDDGFTLNELLIVMAVTGVLLVVVGKGFLQNFTTMRQSQVRSESTGRVQNAMEALSRDVRVADPVVSGSDTSLTVDVLRTGNCYRKTWSLAGNVITQTVVTYASTRTCTGTSTATTASTFLRSVVNGTTPVFTYRDAAGGTTTATAAHQILLQLSVSAAQGTPISLQAAVDLRNVS
jgi:prepilin-type N-terminal cleavage/methylation domain-containing protein